MEQRDLMKKLCPSPHIADGVNITKVKALRDDTGAQYYAIVRALEVSGGDEGAALLLLQSHGFCKWA